MRKRFLLCLFLAACSGGEGSSNSSPVAEVPTALVISSEFVPRIREIGMQYRDWSKLGTTPNFAPELCRAPPLHPLISKSRDDTTHGRKLYFLYVKDVDAYHSAAEHDQPAGQALVKESFEAVEISAEEMEHLNGVSWGQTLSKNGKHWRLGPPRDLFVMHKLDPSTPNTDEGWVYGTSSLALEVSSAGRVASCIECHLDATRDRMFGKR